MIIRGEYIMKLVIGSDISGFYLKEKVKEYLNKKRYDFDDLGTQKLKEGIPFFNVASRVALKIQSKEYDRGILICGTGAGMAIIANKHKGIYAVPVENVYSAKKCRSINNANIMTMGGWIVAPEMACQMVEEFLTTEFTQGLEDWRQVNLKRAIIKISEIENNIYNRPE